MGIQMTLIMKILLQDITQLWIMSPTTLIACTEEGGLKVEEESISIHMT